MCHRVSGQMQLIQRQEANIWNTESESPAPVSKYWQQRVRATPRRSSDSGCLRQVPANELGGPGVLPWFGSSQSRLLVGRPPTPSSGSLRAL